jgi:SAM-dependent methyltransferase
VNGPGCATRRWWACYAAVYDWLWRGPISDGLAAAIAARVVAVGEPIVDAGTGTGLMASRLTQLGPVIGIDSSPAMLARAATRPGRWIVATAPFLPLRGGETATVVAANLVHLCADPVAVIHALVALLRPGGRLILTWPLDDTGPLRVAGAELAGGSRLLATLARLAVRVVVAATAAGLGTVRRAPGHRLTAAVDAVAASRRLHRIDDTVPGGLQHIVVLARPVAPHSPEMS